MDPQTLPLDDLSLDDLPDDLELEKIECQLSLYRFLQKSWHVIEPFTPFIPGWHIEALCEHLEAVSRGQIQNLLIMVPPGSTKSISTCVVWPSWEWTWQPQTRWLYASYSLRLAERDGEKCGNLVRSPWYRQRWGNILTTDAKITLKTAATGWREVASVGSAVTGNHADRLCLPWDGLIDTANGSLEIGKIVEGRLPIDVWSWNHTNDRPELRPVEAWFENPASEVVEIQGSDGPLLQCTPEHPVYIRNRGYIPAKEINAGDQCLMRSGRWEPVLCVVSCDQANRTFNIQVAGNRNYFSNGVLTHNCVDDPHNLVEVESEVIRQGTIDWYNLAWHNRVNDARKSSRVVIAQRTHERDLIGHLEQQGGYVILRLPEEYDAGISRTWSGATIQDPRSEPNELLRPDRFGPDEVDNAKKTLGTVGYSAQHQQRPSPKEGTLVKLAWFRRYAESNDAYRLEDTGEVILKRDCMTFGIIDPAKSKKKTADFTTIMFFAITPTDRMLVRYVFRDRVGYDGIIPKLDELCMIYRPLFVGIEADGFQVMLVKEARTVEFRGSQRVKKYANIPTVEELETEGKGKVTRAQPMIIRARQGEIYLPNAGPSYPWLSPLEMELVQVTGINDDHDDQFDGLAWAVISWDRFGFMADVGDPMILGSAPNPTGW